MGFLTKVKKILTKKRSLSFSRGIKMPAATTTAPIPVPAVTATYTAPVPAPAVQIRFVQPTNIGQIHISPEQYMNRVLISRERGVKIGIILPLYSREPRRFTFSLNQGTIKTLPEISKVFDLMLILWQACKGEAHGEHTSLANLVIRKDDLEKLLTNDDAGNLLWQPASCFKAKLDPERFIRLKDWMRAEGCDLSVFNIS